MSRCNRNKCHSSCLVGMHIFAIIVIGSTIASLCFLCKEKLANILSRMKECACSCKENCSCAYEEIKEDCVCDASEKESDN